MYSDHSNEICDSSLVAAISVHGVIIHTVLIGKTVAMSEHSASLQQSLLPHMHISG